MKLKMISNVPNKIKFKCYRFTFPGDMLGGNVVTFEFVKRAAKAVGRTLLFGLNCGCWVTC